MAGSIGNGGMTGERYQIQCPRCDLYGGAGAVFNVAGVMLLAPMRRPTHFGEGIRFVVAYVVDKGCANTVDSRWLITRTMCYRERCR